MNEEYMRFESEDESRYIKGEYWGQSSSLIGSYIKCEDYERGGLHFWLDIDERFDSDRVYELVFKKDEQCMKLFNIFFTEDYKEYSLMELITMWVDLLNIPFDKVKKAILVNDNENIFIQYLSKDYESYRPSAIYGTDTVALAKFKNRLVVMSKEICNESIKNLSQGEMINKYVYAILRQIAPREDRLDCCDCVVYYSNIDIMDYITPTFCDLDDVRVRDLSRLNVDICLNIIDIIGKYLKIKEICYVNQSIFSNYS